MILKEITVEHYFYTTGGGSTGQDADKLKGENMRQNGTDAESGYSLKRSKL
jgi:hypothetical protein